MANTTKNISALPFTSASLASKFDAPSIYPLKWAINSCLSSLQQAEEATDPKRKQRNLEEPTRPMGATADKGKAKNAVDGFCRLLTKLGQPVPERGTIARSTILGAFGITVIEVGILTEAKAVVRAALDLRTEMAKNAQAAKAANVLNAEAPAKAQPAPKAEAPVAIDGPCPKCGTVGHFTAERPMCGCGQRVFRKRPGRKAQQQAAQAPAAPAAATVGSVVNG